MPAKRDEMIKYASEKNKTECTAFLLEFKNRTADLAAEHEKAEKKMLRELNADPNSVFELKKLWSYEKREDGAVVIIRYKGSRTEIAVPEKIGSSVVAEIGEYAFSPAAPRLRWEQSAFSYCRNLTEIKLPASVTEIGKSAFSACESLHNISLPSGIAEIGEFTFGGCNSLKSVNIPNTVLKIGRMAFQRCYALEKIVVPEGVEEIGDRAFVSCTHLKSVILPESVRKIKNFTYKGREPQTVFCDDKNLTVTVSPKSYSEKYCKRNNIPYMIESEKNRI